jgi:aquaporin Z
VAETRREATAGAARERLGRKLGAELIGTFFLVFTIGASLVSGSSLAPVAIGAVLMVMVYAGGHISGGHFNPAVTVAVWVRGRIKIGEALGYWITQLVAGVLAAGAVRAVTSATAPGRGSTVPGHALVGALVVEGLFTFALAYVVLNVATSKDHPDNSFYGLAIGFTVLAGAVAVGGISGGAFNPAVVLGGALMGLLPWTALAYLVAELLAGVAAGLVFRALNPDDK